MQEYIAEVEGEQLATHGARLGTPWTPLKPRYGLWKVQTGKPVLVLSGGLKASFQGEGRWAIRDRTRTTARFGSKHPLAHIHQRGTAGGRIPARPIMFDTPEIRTAVRAILERHVRGD